MLRHTLHNYITGTRLFITLGEGRNNLNIFKIRGRERDTIEGEHRDVNWTHRGGRDTAATHKQVYKYLNLNLICCSKTFANS